MVFLRKLSNLFQFDFVILTEINQKLNRHKTTSSKISTWVVCLKSNFDPFLISNDLFNIWLIIENYFIQLLQFILMSYFFYIEVNFRLSRELKKNLQILILYINYIHTLTKKTHFFLFIHNRLRNIQIFISNQ